MVALPYMLVLYEIIARLPAKVVTQCKCVCTQWLAELSTQDFTRVHCHYMRTSADQNIILTGRRACVFSSLNPSCVNFARSIDIHIPFNAKPQNLLFLASVDGMLCLCLKNTCELVVWNPLTRAYKKLSNSNSQGFYKVLNDAIGFFVDSSYDYNIIHIKRRRGILTIYIYSLRSGSWKTCRFLKKCPYRDLSYNWSHGTLCKTGLYFIVSQWWLVGDAAMLRFDVNSKVFSEIWYPKALGEGARGSLVNIKDELFMYLYSGFHARKLEFWKMKDDMWARVFVFPEIAYIPLALSSSITYLKLDRTCIAITQWGEVFKLDVRSNGVWSCCPLMFYQALHGAIYTETIVSPGF